MTHLLVCDEFLSQQLAGALQTCADGPLRYSQDKADFARVELVGSRKNEREAQLFRKRVDHGMNDGMPVRGQQCLFRTWLRRRRVCDIVCSCVKRIGPFCRVRTVIDSHSPRYTGKKSSLVLDVWPSSIAIKLQERLLDYIFSVCCVEQDRIGDAEDKA